MFHVKRKSHWNYGTEMHLMVKKNSDRFPINRVLFQNTKQNRHSWKRIKPDTIFKLQK